MDFGLSGMPKGSSPQAATHVKIAQNHGKNAKFRSLAALARVTLGPGGGGWTLDFLGSPRDPPGGGGWTLDFLESPKVPSKRGGLDLGLVWRQSNPLPLDLGPTSTKANPPLGWTSGLLT